MLKNKDKIFDALVVGGGPAGIMASVVAAQKGKSILLMEKNNCLAKKLLISGKGRCNLTNAIEDIEEFLRHFSASGQFLRNAFFQFFNQDLMKFFQSEGLKLKVEQGRRVFPESDKSRDVVEVLLKKLKKTKVEILMNTQVADLKNRGDFFEAITKDKHIYRASKVVLATGGASYPQTGSDGYGLKIASRLGHRIIQPRPGLVAINLEGKLHKCWQAVELKNVECRAESEGKIIDSNFGEMLFTHFGVSGPIILDLSAKIYDTINQGKTVFLRIDFKPALTIKKLNLRLQREFLKHSNKQISNVMKELLPRRIIDGFLKSIPIRSDRRANQISRQERLELVKKLKSFSFKVHSVRSIKEAIITRGGVSTLEIDPKSMESRLIKGLYFAGELIDIDAQTGGYNMQAAFSTGYICGAKI